MSLPAPPSPTLRPLGARRILLVDDDPLVTTLLSHVSAALGFSDVVTAQDGGEALARLAEGPFDVVLADIRMEPMSGLHLASAMRKDPALAAVPVIIMTGAHDPDLVLAAKRLGVSGYLIKPFAPKALRAQLARVLLPAAA